MISINTENIKGKNTKFPLFFMDNSNEYKKYQNNLRNISISNALNDYANSHKLVSVFITLTSEDHNDNKLLAKNDLSRIFQYLQKDLKKSDIINFGIKSFEKNKNNIYHMHIILFCLKEDIEKIQKITAKYFKNEINKNELSFQKVIRETTQHIIQYIHKIEFNNDTSKQESNLISYSEISFFGIEKIIKEYDRIYKKDFSEIDFERYQKLGILDNIKRDLKIHNIIKSKKIFTALAELGAFTKLSKKINSKRWKQQRVNSHEIRKLFSKKTSTYKMPLCLTLERDNSENTNITKKERLNYLSYIPPPFER
ncbi:MAG: replication endonuclease [Acetobacter orientalis]|uniref:replication endonuclease n=1 Tax=Acetobacter orientalis TaxID=146474 RepID=UPI0039EBC297